MRTILFPTDFSDNANDALQYALAFIKDIPAKLIVLNVFDVPHSHAGVLKSIKDIMRNDSEEGLKVARALIMMEESNRSLEVEYIAKMGSTISEIRNVADEHKADFIIMGTKGASGLKEVLMGSITSSLMKSKGCSVIAIPRNYKYVRPRNIVFAADLRKAESSQGLKPLAELAGMFKCNIDIMHVNVNAGQEIFETPEAKSIDFALSGVDHKFHLVQNTDIKKAIEEFISGGERDMLFMVIRKYNLIEALFHTSVTEKIAHHTTLPVVVLHE